MSSSSSITYRWDWQADPVNPFVGYVNEHASCSKGFTQYGPMSREDGEAFVAGRKRDVEAIQQRVRDTMERKLYAIR